MNNPLPAVKVDHLVKTYVVPEREAGMKAALQSLVRRKTREVKAVNDISFQVAQGEIVGFLGPNGAGKTTTLKMLSGLLYPTGGDVRVLGYEPSRRERDFLSQITLVMGQRNQLVWDIPAADSFELNRAIYNIPQEQFKQTLNELVDLLDLGSLMTKPVRNLSLGERMKCEIAGALLHRPRVLFLDEPTIGLDVTAQRRIREFIREYNQRHGAAVLLTSHYMADVEALAKRVVVIHHGRIIFDGQLAELAQRFNANKTIVVKPGAEPLDPVQLAQYGEVIGDDPTQYSIRVPRQDATRVTARILSELPITDVSITDPPIEEAIERIFNTPEDLDEQTAAPVTESA
jgi:ABC-2 type transport system ATP-binding protein